MDINNPNQPVNPPETPIQDQSVSSPVNNQKGFFPIILGVLVLLLIVGAGAYYLGLKGSNLITGTNQYSVSPTPLPIQPTTTTPNTNPNYSYGTNYQILSGCNQDECLFKSPSEEWVVEGYAKLQGYFHTYVADDYGNKVTCSSILVTGGNEKLIESFKTQIKKGNTVNKLDKDDNLLINIDLNNLDSVTKSLIQSSSKNNSVELGVIRRTPRPMGASTCSNFVEILFAKSLAK